jgi:endonuclease/exonuclease/phosphatase family metal-dependent hydrolase
LLTKAYPLAENTTARIMTANILADAFADSSYNKASYRAEIFAGMLVAYTPDVIGLQEVDESWNQAIDDYLARLQSAHGITYSRHLATYEGKVNYTSLLYRSDKFKVEDSGVNPFTWWTDRSFNHNYHMRNISWAQFSSLADAGKKFIVANTHWSYRTEHADGKTYLANSATPIAANELREQCKNETNNFMSKLKQTYSGMPIFLTGDFNTSLSFFTQSGWTPTAFRIISEEAKTNGTSLSTVPVSGHYDHLFGTGNYTVRHYAFFTDTDYHNLLTDHPFAYADLAF